MNNYTDYLSHHGIKGQKWGVRRYQTSNGSWTELGNERRRIGDDRHKKHDSPSKKQESKEKTEPNSKNGLSTKQKVAIGASVAAVALAGAYAAKRVGLIGEQTSGRYAIDTYLEAGTELSRIQTNSEFENFAFYATYKKHDVNEYTGLFGKNLKDRANYAARKAEKTAKKTGTEEALAVAKQAREYADNLKIHQLKINTDKRLKVPSEKNAGDITASLLKDSSFKKNLIDSINDSSSKMKRPTQQSLFKDARRALQKDPSSLTEKEKISIYKALNLSLTDHNETQQAMQKTFYGEMKKRGYGALVDINDQSLSSYHAKRPMIIFDTDSTSLKSVREIDEKTVSTLYSIYNSERILKEATTNLPKTLFGVANVSITNITDYTRTRATN